MSKSVEEIIEEISQLPSSEQDRLRHLLDQHLLSRGQRVNPATFPDSTCELEWIVEHAKDYAGEWVALDGNRLIAHGHDANDVFAAADADGAVLPLVTYVDDPEKVYAGF